MFWKRAVYRTSNDLRDRKFDTHRDLSAAQKRRLIKIGVIDDQVFAPRSNLENLGYKIENLGDVASVSRIEKFQIVLCDLQGVGTALDAKKQGAFLIREIKRNYPEKFIIAYTGGGLNALISREASTDADHLLKKDADIDDWVDLLDGIIARILSPYQVWQRQREALVAREIDTLTILKLETAFVQSFSQEEGSKAAFEKFVSSEKLQGDVRAIVQGVIASGLYALLTR